MTFSVAKVAHSCAQVIQVSYTQINTTLIKVYSVAGSNKVLNGLYNNQIYYPKFHLLGNDDPCRWIGQIIRDSSSGEILSPNYPDAYPNDATCQWHIQVDRGFVVRLTFIDFSLEDG